MPHILVGNRFVSIAAIEARYSILKTLQAMGVEVFMAKSVLALHQGLKCLSTGIYEVEDEDALRCMNPVAGDTRHGINSSRLSSQPLASPTAYCMISV
jgi:hypothetical protein